MGMGRREESGDYLSSCMQIRFVEMGARRGLKVNAGKSMSKNLYLVCVLAESGTDGVECSRKVMSGRRELKVNAGKSKGWY